MEKLFSYGRTVGYLSLNRLHSKKKGCNSHQNYTHVHQLFTADSLEWSISLPSDLFDSDIVNLILHIPIHMNHKDKLVWLLEKNGKFSVKSCYRKMYEELNLIQLVGDRMRKIYNNMWKLPTLPRIRQFLWKAISDLLATKEALGPGIVGSDDSYWICSWFDSLFNGTISEFEIVKRDIIAWSIWTERCDKVFQQSNSSLEKIIQRCNMLIEEHAARNIIMPSPSHRVNRQNVHWIPPSIDSLTINCDDSFDSTNISGGIGLIIRNFAGTHQATRCIHSRGIRSAKQAECMGLWEAVQWVKELRMEKVHFKMDAKVIVDAVNKDNGSIDRSLHHFVLDIREFYFFSS
ncbi:uncharacterized protein LOC113312708 [Papaver somniferum]|uniref:uncharacterized protein LOC113312708 n=1 Tax=Papaver somniferum TaxID=3469 RepID=UPI000E6F9791|nr:uncharacterized protein LOC113312708 [Papaver somniferum]